MAASSFGRRSLSVGILLYFLPACLLAPLCECPANAGTGFRLPQGSDLISIPLARAWGLVLVRAAIDGKDAGWFIVDTGSAHTIIDEKVAQRLSLKTIREFPNIPHNGSLAAAHSLSLDGAVHDLTSIEVNDLGKGFASGLIGADLLADQAFTLDYDSQAMVLYAGSPPPEPVHGPGDTLQKLEIWHGRPFVKCTLENTELSLLLDTGSAYGLELWPSGFFRLRGHLETGHPAEVWQNHFYGLRKESAADHGPFRVFNQEYNKVWTTWDLEDTGQSDRLCDGMFGDAFFEGARLTFDLNGKQLWYRPPPRRSAEDVVKSYKDVNAGDLAGITPLMRAAAANRADVIQLLLDRSARVDATSMFGQSALSLACDGSCTDAAKVLLAAKASPKTATAEYLESPLHMAAKRGNSEIMKMLLASGADVNAADWRGDTPLFRAVEIDSMECVKLLLDAGADINHHDRLQWTPLVIGACRGSPSEIEFLLKSGAVIEPQAPVQPLTMACFYGKTENVKALIKNGASVNISDSNGITPLMLAARSSEQVELVDELLSNGADGKAVSKEGKTAADYAADSNNFKVLGRLMQSQEQVAAPLTPPTQGQPTHNAAATASDIREAGNKFQQAIARADAKAARQFVLTNATSERWLDSLIETWRACNHLEEISVAKFGPAVKGQFNFLPSDTFDNAQIEVDGDKASTKVNTRQYHFIKTDQGWKIDLQQGTDADYQTQIANFQKLIAPVNKTSKEIAQGMYTTAAAAQQALMNNMTLDKDPAQTQPSRVASVSESDIRDLGEGFNAAMRHGDAKAARQCALTDATGARWINTTADAWKAHNHLESVAISKFGPAARGKIAFLYTVRFDEAQVEIDGDKAAVRTKNSLYKFVRTSEGWKIDFRQMPQTELEEQITRLQKLIVLANQTADDISQGKCTTIIAAQQALSDNVTLIRNLGDAYQAALMRGDAETARQCVLTDSTSERWLDAGIEMAKAMNHLQSVAATQFGPSANGLVNFGHVESFDNAQIDISGDKASAKVNDRQHYFLKTEEGWKLDMRSGGNEAAFEAQIAEFQKAAAAANKTSDEIALRKYKTLADVRNALTSNMALAMRGDQGKNLLRAAEPAETQPSRARVAQQDDGKLVLWARDTSDIGHCRILKVNDVQCVTAWDHADDIVRWEASLKTLPQQGIYEVMITYACDPDADGTEYVVDVGDQHVKAKAHATGEPGGWPQFDSEAIGWVHLDHPGDLDVSVHATKKAGREVMHIRSIVLKPATEQQIAKRIKEASPAPQADAPKTAPTICIDISELPDLEDWGYGARDYCRKWYPVVDQLLHSDGFTPPRVFGMRVILDPGAVGHNDNGGSFNVTAFTTWENTIMIFHTWALPNDYGMEIHEMSHVIQRYQQREFWVTEGIADYIRYYIVEPGSRQGRFDPATAHYKNGYQAASAFLNWMENKYGKPTGHSIISRLNDALRHKSYDPSIFREMTGKDIDALWDEFKTTLNSDHRQPASFGPASPATQQIKEGR